MDSIEENKRRNRFKEVIHKLSDATILSDAKKRGELYTSLKYIYKGTGKDVDFHHYYSDIFIALVKVREDGGEIEIVGDNLKKLYEYCLTKADKELNDSVRKFLDHANLEIARINYVSQIDDKVQNIDKVEENIKRVSDVASSQEQKVNELKKSTDDSYSNFISILGIFSAIVLVFFGGSSIFGNVISSMYHTPAAKCILVCLVVGVIVFDIVFMFILFLSKLLGRSISSIDYDPYYENNIFNKLKMKYPIVFYTNLISCVVGSILVIYLMMEKAFDIIISNKKVGDIFEEHISLIYVEHETVFWLILLLLIADTLFLFAFIVTHLTDKNIGTTIHIRYIEIYWYDTDGYSYDCMRSGECKKSFADEKSAIFWVKYHEIIESCYVYITNILKRLFLRYPYMSILNTIIIVAMFIKW